MLINCVLNYVYVRSNLKAQSDYVVCKGRGSSWRRMLIPPELWAIIYGYLPLDALFKICKVVPDVLPEEHPVMVALSPNMLDNAAFHQWDDDRPPLGPPQLPQLEYYRLLTSPYCTTCPSNKFNYKGCRLLMAYNARICPDCRADHTINVSDQFTFYAVLSLTPSVQ